MADKKPNPLVEKYKADNKKQAELGALYKELSQTHAGRQILNKAGLTEDPTTPRKGQGPVAKFLNAVVEGTLLAPETLIPAVGAADLMAQVTTGKGAAKEAEATIVPALAKLKGMKGIHPGYDVEAFLRAEASAQGINLSTALERKYGIFRTPEGLKTNVSDAGSQFEYGGRDIVWDTRYDAVGGGPFKPLSSVIRHPNRETIEAAVDEPLFEKLRLRRNISDDAQGSFYPSGPRKDTIDINTDDIARNPNVRSAGTETNILAVILHELGHGVQKYAGQQGGANIRMARQAPEFTETAGSIAKLIEKSGNTERATEQILNYVQNGGKPIKLAGKSQQEVQDIMSDVISDTVYRAHAGEQSSNAAMKRFILQETFKHDPAIVKALEDTPITSQMTVPVWDQIYDPWTKVTKP